MWLNFLLDLLLLRGSLLNSWLSLFGILKVASLSASNWLDSLILNSELLLKITNSVIGETEVMVLPVEHLCETSFGTKRSADHEQLEVLNSEDFVDALGILGEANDSVLQQVNLDFLSLFSEY